MSFPEKNFSHHIDLQVFHGSVFRISRILFLFQSSNYILNGLKFLCSPPPPVSLVLNINISVLLNINFDYFFIPHVSDCLLYSLDRSLSG